MKYRSADSLASGKHGILLPLLDEGF